MPSTTKSPLSVEMLAPVDYSNYQPPDWDDPVDRFRGPWYNAGNTLTTNNVFATTYHDTWQGSILTPPGGHSYYAQLLYFSNFDFGLTTTQLDNITSWKVTAKYKIRMFNDQPWVLSPTGVDVFAWGVPERPYLAGQTIVYPDDYYPNLNFFTRLPPLDTEYRTLYQVSTDFTTAIKTAEFRGSWNWTQPLSQLINTSTWGILISAAQWGLVYNTTDTEDYTFYLDSITVTVTYDEPVDPFEKFFAESFSFTEEFIGYEYNEYTDELVDELIPSEVFWGHKTIAPDESYINTLVPFELFEFICLTVPPFEELLEPIELFTGQVPSVAQTLVPVELFEVQGPFIGAVSETLVAVEDFYSHTVYRLYREKLTPVEVIATTGSVIHAGHGVSHLLSPTESFTFDIIGSRSYTDTLTVSEGFSGYILDESGTCGSTDVYIDGPTLTPVNSLILSYPTVTPTSTVTLRAPNLGNTEDASATRIYRQTRGRVVKELQDPIWTTTRLMRYSFAYLTLAQQAELFDFVQVSLGKLVRLTDHESRVWDGIITNPNGNSTQEKMGTCCYTFEFDFQGTLV